MAQSWVLVFFQFLFLIFLVSIRFSQSNPQNIETFYPGTEPFPSPPPEPAPPPESGLPPPQDVPAPPHRASPTRSEVVRAVVATAASTLVFAAVFFFCLQKYCLSRRSHGGGKLPPAGETQFADDDGLDVLYWRKLEERNKNTGKKKNGYEVLQKNHNPHEEHEEDLRKNPKPTPEIPLLHEKSSNSYDFNRVGPQIEDKHQIQAPPAAQPPPPAPKSAAPPPPPPPVARNSPPAPPAPPRANGSKAPAPPPRNVSAEESNGQVKLKPLHWDKLNTNTDHSMVWNKLDKGSFKFDSDLMESLFGYVGGISKTSAKPTNVASGQPSSQITLLDPRKSQNIAIVLKSLSISHNDLINALREGHGLDADTIDKLTRISPTIEEQNIILGFPGDPKRLADAESFLHHTLKSIPSAFNRVRAMHFRSQYFVEIAQLSESIKSLELGCNELRTGGLFMKLLEAVLKAGNRMNAGTARGNAQAFDLTALRKLSDVKSTDGRTTLLHFVVEEVVRSEGKKCMLNKNRNLARNDGSGSDASREDKERLYTMLGLPSVGGLSSEFTNVKKSASIDHDAFSTTYSNLSSRVSETKKLVQDCDTDEFGAFGREMSIFLEKAEVELEFVKEEQWRVVELVKRTTEYYQAGAFKDRGGDPLHLFVIVKDFLAMVDQVCIEIARNLQKRKAATASLGPALRSKAKFPTLPKHFMSEKSGSSSSDSDE